LNLVKQEQERLRILEQTLLGVSYAIEFEGEVNWSVIFGVIQLYQQNPEDALQQYKDYLDDEEMKKIMELTPNKMDEADIQEWIEAIRDIKENLAIDPHSEKAQQLVERWSKQAANMFGHDDELLGDMWEALQNLKEGIVFYPMDKNVIDFIERVYLKKEESK